MHACDGGKQVGRECGNTALAREVVADECDLAYFICFFHKIFGTLSARTMNLLGAEPTK